MIALTPAQIAALTSGQKFNMCLAFTDSNQIEGGCSDVKGDPGGRTYKGIEQAEYDAWQHIHNGVTGDVCKAPLAIIQAIYLHSYWLPYCDTLPQGLNLMYFDTGVNEGIGKSVLFLQRALKIDDDGHFGIVTASQTRLQCATPDGCKAIITAMADERRVAYKRMRKLFKEFGAGWLERVKLCEAASLGMVDGLDPKTALVA